MLRYIQQAWNAAPEVLEEKECLAVLVPNNAWMQRLMIKMVMMLRGFRVTAERDKITGRRRRLLGPYAPVFPHGWRPPIFRTPEAAAAYEAGFVQIQRDAMFRAARRKYLISLCGMRMAEVEDLARSSAAKERDKTDMEEICAKVAALQREQQCDAAEGGELFTAEASLRASILAQECGAFAPPEVMGSL